jgi:hypothetical protein
VEGTLEEHALGCQPVDVWRPQIGVPARAEFIIAQIVHKNDEEIRLSHAKINSKRVRLKPNGLIFAISGTLQAPGDFSIGMDQ